MVGRSGSVISNVRIIIHKVVDLGVIEIVAGSQWRPTVPGVGMCAVGGRSGAASVAGLIWSDGSCLAATRFMFMPIVSLSGLRTLKRGRGLVTRWFDVVN